MMNLWSSDAIIQMKVETKNENAHHARDFGLDLL